MPHEIVNPEDWKAPVGYSNAVLAQGGRILFLGGQVAFATDPRGVMAYVG